MWEWMSLRQIRVLAATACFLTVGIALRAHAQEGSPTKAQVASARIFLPEFFATYHPITALDMVSRIPGFRIAGGEGLRGFGQNAGNVLIDGERPSSKSDDIYTILGRIPASAVLRLELSEAGAGTADARAQGQTVNVVRIRSRRPTGTYSAAVEFGRRSGQTPIGDASLTVERGKTSVTLGASHFEQYNRGDGTRTQSGSAIGRTRVQHFDQDNFYVEESLSGAIKSKVGSAVVNANTKATHRRGCFRQNFSTFTSLERLGGCDPGPSNEYEVGGDVALPVAPHLATKTIFLFNASANRGTGFDTISGTNAGLVEQTSDSSQHAEEVVLRSQTDWTPPASRHAVQFGTEFARNVQTSQFRAASIADGVVTLYPAPSLRVVENRWEPFVSDAIRLSKRWQLELALVAESSTLAVSGDQQARTGLFYWKPRAVATWTPDKMTSLELRVERSVAQLDFNDFTTNIDFAANNQLSTANRFLRPENFWRYQAKARRTFWDRGALEVTAGFADINDTQDLVPITLVAPDGTVARYDGPGNIGHSTRARLDFSGTLPLDRFTKHWGIHGLQLEASGFFRRAYVTDPVTHQSRFAANRSNSHINVTIRQDLEKLGISWSVNYDRYGQTCSYYLASTSCSSTLGEVFASIAYKKLKIGTVALNIGNPFNVRTQSQATYYMIDRAQPDIAYTNSRDYRRDFRVKLSLEGKF